MGLGRVGGGCAVRVRRTQQADAAGDPWRELDRLLGGQCLQMLIDALAVFQSQARRDFAARGRPAVIGDERFDESQDDPPVAD